MIVYSIIRKSQLEGAHRLDAEYYQPEYLALASKLKNARTIDTLASDIRYGLYVEPDYRESGVNFIRAMNTTNFWIDGEVLKIHEKLVPKEYFLATGDCLIVRSGANTGLVSVIYPRWEKATFGSYTIRIRFDKVNPFFAAVFLNTKYGLSQTQRSQTGAAQPNLNIPNIREIKIPLIAKDQQEAIEKLCLLIDDTRRKSEDIYSQAEHLLLEEVGLKNFEEGSGLYSVVRLSKVKEKNRMDAEYFQPKYEKMIRKIQSKTKVIRLDEIAVIKRGSLIAPIHYADEGVPYIRGGDFSSGWLEEAKLARIKNFQAENETRVKTGDVVFASIGSVGTLALVSDEFDNAFISNNTAKISIKDKGVLLLEYLTLALQSIVGKWQFEKEMSQTAQPKISDSQVKSFCIPILSMSKQRKIADLVRQSHEARKKAKNILEQAKHTVKQMIEAR